MAQPFPPGATATHTVPLLPTPCEESIAAWPRLELTPAQLAHIKNGQHGWLLKDAPGIGSNANVVMVAAPPGQEALTSQQPRVAGPQVAQGQAATPPTVNLAQVAQAATPAINQPTGQLVGAVVRGRQQAAGGQAIRVAGPMTPGGAPAAQSPQAAAAGSGMWGVGMQPPAPAGLARPVAPTQQTQRARPIAQGAVAFGVLGCVAAFAPLALHLLVIASVIIGLIALSLGAGALRLAQRGMPEQRMARIGLALGVIGLVASVALTVVSVAVLHH